MLEWWVKHKGRLCSPHPHAGGGEDSPKGQKVMAVLEGASWEHTESTVCAEHAAICYDYRHFLYLVFGLVFSLYIYDVPMLICSLRITWEVFLHSIFEFCVDPRVGQRARHSVGLFNYGNESIVCSASGFIFKSNNGKRRIASTPPAHVYCKEILLSVAPVQPRKRRNSPWSNQTCFVWGPSDS